jgi:hypothetical protein
MRPSHHSAPPTDRRRAPARAADGTQLAAPTPLVTAGRRRGTQLAAPTPLVAGGRRHGSRPASWLAPFRRPVSRKPAGKLAGPTRRSGVRWLAAPASHRLWLDLSVGGRCELSRSTVQRRGSSAGGPIRLDVPLVEAMGGRCSASRLGNLADQSGRVMAVPGGGRLVVAGGRRSGADLVLGRVVVWVLGGLGGAGVLRRLGGRRLVVLVGVAGGSWLGSLADQSGRVVAVAGGRRSGPDLVRGLSRCADSRRESGRAGTSIGLGGHRSVVLGEAAGGSWLGSLADQCGSAMKVYGCGRLAMLVPRGLRPDLARGCRCEPSERVGRCRCAPNPASGSRRERNSAVAQRRRSGRAGVSIQLDGRLLVPVVGAVGGRWAHRSGPVLTARGAGGPAVVVTAHGAGASAVASSAVADAGSVRGWASGAVRPAPGYLGRLAWDVVRRVVGGWAAVCR